MDARNHPYFRPARRLPGIVAVCAWLLAGLAATGVVRAQETGVAVSNARTELVDGVWYLSARVDYRLSLEALDALQNGIPLTFELQLELEAVRNWLPDSTVAELRQDYELTWEPLARSYLVRNLNSGDRRSHKTLYAALAELGKLYKLPVIDSALLAPDVVHEIALRVVLDQQRLPGPLRLLAFWSDGFTLESEWYRWRLGE